MNKLIILSFSLLVLTSGCSVTREVKTSLTQGNEGTIWFLSAGTIVVCDNIFRLLPLERVPDVYGALRLLATHPKIDPNKVILMGFSHGGMLTANAATL